MSKSLQLLVLLFTIILSPHGMSYSVDSSNTASNRITFADGKIPYFRNIDIEDLPKVSSIDTAVIVIHGTLRNAGSQYVAMLNAMNKHKSAAASTVIIAPQFLAREDIVESYEGERGLLYWTDTGWEKGASAKNKGRLSSFKVIDLIVRKLSKSEHIKNLVIIGHSTGGQFVNRYAALSGQSFSKFKKVKFIAANAPSYLYFNKNRFEGENYSIPVTKEPFNSYIYGIDKMRLSYIKRSYAFNSNRYKRRDNILLLGENDTERAESLDQSTSADYQGLNRLERGLNYKKHLDRHFQTHNTTVVTVPGIGHDYSSMFSSEPALKLMFN